MEICFIEKLCRGFLCFMLISNLVTGNKTCDPSDLTNNQCPDTQSCSETTLTCNCRPGFKAKNATFCVLEKDINNSQSSTPNHSSLVASDTNGSVVAGIVVPLSLILFVIYAVYVSRKYNLVSWFRRKIHQRNNNYDEFMIGQDQDTDDDPPIA